MAAAVVGDTNSYRYFAEVGLRWSSSTTNATSARKVALVCLLLPSALPNLEPVLKLADLAIEGVPAEARHGRMAKGLAEYRRGHWREALAWVDDSGGRQSGVNYGASRCGYICAMAHFQLGEEITARAELEEAGERLADSVASGHVSDWFAYGGNVVLRAEAERLILGREVSTVMDSAGLEHARKRWAPVRQWLLEAERLAGQRQRPGPAMPFNGPWPNRRSTGGSPRTIS